MTSTQVKCLVIQEGFRSIGRVPNYLFLKLPDQDQIFTGSCTLQGVSPLIMDSRQTLFDDQPCWISDVNKDPEASAKLAREIASRQLRRMNPKDPNSPICLTAEEIMTALWCAGRHVNIPGTRKIFSTLKRNLIPYLITMSAESYPLLTQQWEVDMRVHKMPSGRHSGYPQPRLNEWAVQIEFIFQPTESVGEKFLYQLFVRAGKMTGFGLWRPAFNGVFGRFRIENWKLQEKKVARAA